MPEKTRDVARQMTLAFTPTPDPILEIRPDPNDGNLVEAISFYLLRDLNAEFSHPGLS
ncbi:MAG: hypothetical protein ABJ251_01350 [Paracoccaceae bacterium]